MKAFEAAGGFEESDEPCELCGEARQTDANLLLECERCLRGFHMACLTPPLTHVPEVRTAAPALPAQPDPALHTNLVRLFDVLRLFAEVVTHAAP